MVNKEMRNLKLTGNGAAAGGNYENIRMTGENSVNGDLACIDMRVTGTCEFNGNVSTKTAKTTGTLDIKGKLEAEEFRIVGTINVNGDAVVKEITIYGEAKVNGNASIEKANIFGFLDIGGECNTESFTSKGPFKIGGLLNAGNIDIETHSKCLVREVGGERISIRRGTDMLIKKIIKSLYMPKDFYLGQLITDTIEGDDIYLEYVKAKVVRGNNIEVGPGCEIGLVEYKDTFKQRGDSNVGDNRKI